MIHYSIIEVIGLENLLCQDKFSTAMFNVLSVWRSLNNSFKIE